MTVADSKTRQHNLSHQIVLGFGPGTHLMTSEGEVPVEWLAVGDMLITRDNGPQPVLWVGRYPVSLEGLEENPALAPVMVAANALGPNHPSHDTLLSRQHRLLLSGYPVELHFGADEAFAAAKHLTDGDKIHEATLDAPFKYTHVLLARHEVIQANNMWVESLNLGQSKWADQEPRMRRALMDDKKLRDQHRQTARLCLKKWEVAAMTQRRAQSMLPEIIHRVA